MGQRGKTQRSKTLKAVLVPLGAIVFVLSWQVFTVIFKQPMLYGNEFSGWILSLICEPAFWLSVFFVIYMFVKGWLKRVAQVLLIAAFWFAVWQAAAIVVNKPLFMPSPAETFIALDGLLGEATFWLSVGFTLYRVVLGMIISFIAGVLLALLASRLPMLQSLLRPIVAAIKSTPVISIIFLALVWFSSSDVPIFSCVLLCFPIFFANTLSGIQSVDKELLELASVFRVRHGRVLREIIVPSVLPNIYSATSVCLGFSWKSVVAAEVLSVPDYAVGYELSKTKLYLDTPELFAWTLTIIVISIIIEKGLKQLMPAGSTI